MERKGQNPPRFEFPPRHSTSTPIATSTSRTTHPYSTTQSSVDSRIERRERPRIELKIKEEEAYKLTVPTRPQPLRTPSTPPDSPTRQRAYTMEDTTLRIPHGSGAVTPPSTPTSATHAKSHSASSITDSLTTLRRGDSTSSRIARARRDTMLETERQGSAEPRKFPYWLTDYEIDVDENGKKKPLGSGVWSDVYLAKPCLPKPVPSSLPALSGSDMTPPNTPAHSRASSIKEANLLHLPPAYAIKTPATRSARKVLSEEGRILSHLAQYPDSSKYMIEYFGQDSRIEALVLKAMDSTLETWMQKKLNSLNEADRAAKLAAVFPTLAKNLLDGLAWIHEHGCVHADVKPSNILVSSSSEAATIETVYTDFSSAHLTTPTSPTCSSSSSDANGNPPKPPLGGGTWDFLDPLLLTTTTPVSPSAATDLWALAMTLLTLVIGASPFDCVGANVWRRRDIIKHGTPLVYVAYGDDGARNLKRMGALSKALGWDIAAWFGRVLEKDVENRVSLTEWRARLDCAVG